MFFGQGQADIFFGEIVVVEGIVDSDDLVEHVRIDDFHARQIFHMIDEFALVDGFGFFRHVHSSLIA